MCESGNPFAPGLLELRRNRARLQGLSGDAPQAHEVKAGDRIALDKLEGEEHNHSEQPGNLHEIPTAIELDHHPEASRRRAPGTTSPS